MRGVRSDSLVRFEFVTLLVANHGYAVCGGGGFGILSDFSAILITGNVGAFVRSDCVDRVYLAIIGKVGMCV